MKISLHRLLPKAFSSSSLATDHFARAAYYCGARITIPGLAIKREALTDDIGTALAAVLHWGAVRN